MKLYKIKPLEWEDQQKGDWDMRDYPLLAAVTAVALYEIEKLRNGCRLVIDGNWRDKVLFGTFAEVKQAAEKDYLERVEKSLEAVETKPMETKLTAIARSAEWLTRTEGIKSFEIDINGHSYIYGSGMNELAGKRFVIKPIFHDNKYDYNGAGYDWLKYWLKDFKEE